MILFSHFVNLITTAGDVDKQWALRAPQLVLPGLVFLVPEGDEVLGAYSIAQLFSLQSS